jgi:hypothetical protein
MTHKEECIQHWNAQREFDLQKASKIINTYYDRMIAGLPERRKRTPIDQLEIDFMLGNDSFIEQQ